MARKRRTRTSHPGVKVVVRTYDSGRKTWRGVYVDPDSGKTVAVNLDRLGHTNATARTEWARRTYKRVVARRAEIESGAALVAHTELKAVAERYLATCASRLRPRTLEGYRENVARFLAWAEDDGIAEAEAIDAAALARYRDGIILSPRTRAAKGAKRGARQVEESGLSAGAINRRLREAKAFVNYARVRGFTPRLSRDLITEALRAERAPRTAPEPLTASDCGLLMAAALRHDAARHKLTRVEHARSPSAVAVFQTPKHAPIAPLLAFVLLTGCRIGEALTLRWDAIDLAALDDYGNAVGEVRLRATATKTHTERRIDLSVCPTVRSLLTAMRLQATGEYVFGQTEPLARSVADNGRARLVRKYGAPSFTWQRLRQTCASYLTNAPGIFRAASIYRSAEQLGHSPQVAQRHYLGRVRGIPRYARTLEAALQIAEFSDSLVAQARGADVVRLPVSVDEAGAA